MVASAVLLRLRRFLPGNSGIFADLSPDASLVAKLSPDGNCGAAQGKIAHKGSPSTGISEKTFSETRHLGNRVPYRPPRLYAMQRGICNRFNTQKHHDWYKGLCGNVYKTKKVRLKMEKRKVSRFARFKLFRSANGLMGNGAKDIWRCFR